MPTATRTAKQAIRRRRRFLAIGEAAQNLP
jgi:hypothetical protein